MKFYICPEEDRDGVYYLITEKGEFLASHYCSGKSYAKGDLEANRPERQKIWKKKFGKYKVLYLGEDKVTKEKLRELNKKWAEKEKSPKKK